MKILIALLLSLLAAPSAHCQEKSEYPRFTYSGEEFSPGINSFIKKNNLFHVYLSNYLHKHHPSVKAICSKGIVFVKFRLDANGLNTLACSKDTPYALNEALKAGVRAAAKYWAEVKTNKSYWIVQPFIYDYGIDCKQISLAPSLEGSLVFDDGTRISDSPCLVLEPLITSSGVPEQDLSPLPKN